MKVNELRDLSTAELEEKLAESKQELFNLRFQNAINQLENPKRIGEGKYFKLYGFILSKRVLFLVWTILMVISAYKIWILL